jgi:predicted MPP superfamily phosphohydrolase
MATRKANPAGREGELLMQGGQSETQQLPTRRQFVRRAVKVGATLTGVTTAYGFWEASQIRLRRQTVALPHLPRSLAGTTIAVLADFHHGPFVGIRFIREAVRLANSLRPDAFALVGDFGHNGKFAASQLPPCLEAVSLLRAPLGVFAVPGNHDVSRGAEIYRQGIASTPITDLTNSSVCLSSADEGLWLAGVDDLWWGKPNLEAALGRIPLGAAVVLLSHNPDFAEESPDNRVGLVLSGHTHGGQVYLPVLGAPWVPSRYGRKYCGGLAQAPGSQVYVSRGLGEAAIPVRLNCPPEINLLTLLPEQAKEV